MQGTLLSIEHLQLCRLSTWFLLISLEMYIAWNVHQKAPALKRDTFSSAVVWCSLLNNRLFPIILVEESISHYSENEINDVVSLLWPGQNGLIVVDVILLNIALKRESEHEWKCCAFGIFSCFQRFLHWSCTDKFWITFTWYALYAHELYTGGYHCRITSTVPFVRNINKVLASDLSESF